MSALDRESQLGPRLVERPLRAAHRDHGDRYRGDCVACGLPKQLHFAGRRCTGRYLGCASARDVADFLAGHGLPRPSDQAPEPVEAAAPRTS